MKARSSIITALILFGSVISSAQNGTVSSGGQASGSGGSVSYSVGLVNYISVQSAEGRISQGLQQPYEIFVYSGVDEPGITLEATVFPNPSADFLTLSIEGQISGDLEYSLFDEMGKHLLRSDITDNHSEISLVPLPSATYFLKVQRGGKEVKTFRIIKTN